MIKRTELRHYFYTLLAIAKRSEVTVCTNHLTTESRCYRKRVIGCRGCVDSEQTDSTRIYYADPVEANMILNIFYAVNGFIHAKSRH